MNTATWKECVAAFTEEQARHLCVWRGFSAEFVAWLRVKELVGLYKDKFAFPNHGEGGEVVSCHYRLDKRKWRFEPEGNRTAPILFGTAATAGFVLTFESQWDAFAVMDKLGWHKERDGLPDSAVIVTRGATNGKLVEGMCGPESMIYAFAQNDEVKNGRKAGDEWLKTVCASAGCKVLHVATPAPHKDANDWTKAGATADNLWSAIRAAKVVFEPSQLEIVTREPAEVEPLPVAGKFPIESLNGVMRRMAEESADVHQTAIELPAMSTIAVLAGSLGKGWRLEGAVNGKASFGNLYVICAAPKSYGKGATSTLAQPIIAVSDELAEQFRVSERPKLQAEQREMESRIKAISGQLGGQNAQGKLTEPGRERLREELAKRIQRSSAIEPLLQMGPSYWIGNTTTAAFVEHLARNGDTLFSFSPEAGELVRIALGKFNKDDAADLDLLLSGYSVETWRDSRIGRGDKSLVPCISALWFCQPMILRELLCNEEALERGMTARLLPFAVEHDTIPEDDGVSRLVQPVTLKGWQSLIRETLTLRSKVTEPPLVQCSPAAREVFRHFHNESVRLRNGRFHDMEGELGRWRENAIRLALGQYVADKLTLPGGGSETLSESQALRAVAIARWCVLSALAFTQQGRQERRFQQVKELRDVVFDYQGEVTLRDLERRHGYTKAHVESLVADFPDQLALTTVRREGGGRPSEILVVPQRKAA